MREYKFRGKRLDNGEWIYGDLFKTWDQCYILWGTTNDLPNMIEVDPSTIGQYTGLKDKNGKEIYEGDIVKVFVCERYINGYVKYNQGKGRFDIGWMCEVEKYKSGNDFLGSCSCMDNEYDWLEVIGNIYDNPELL